MTLPTTDHEQDQTTRALHKIRRRSIDTKRYDQALAQGMEPLAARVLCARPFSVHAQSLNDQIQPSTDRLTPPGLLPDIDQAARRLALAVVMGQSIALETDHDVDGVSSHAVLKSPAHTPLKTILFMQ